MLLNSILIEESRIHAYFIIDYRQIPDNFRTQCNYLQEHTTIMPKWHKQSRGATQHRMMPRDGS